MLFSKGKHIHPNKTGFPIIPVGQLFFLVEFDLCSEYQMLKANILGQVRHSINKKCLYTQQAMVYIIWFMI